MFKKKSKLWNKEQRISLKGLVRDIHNVLSAYFSYLVMATKDGHNISNLKIDANLRKVNLV